MALQDFHLDGKRKWPARSCRYTQAIQRLAATMPNHSWIEIDSAARAQSGPTGSLYRLPTL